MICPKCDSNTLVKDTRSNEHRVVRKRVCKKCGYTYFTSEQICSSEAGENFISNYWRAGGVADRLFKNT